MKTVNGFFDYKVDNWSSRWSSTFLRVYSLADRVAVVIATEVADNPGPSITNSAEALATEVVKEYNLDPLRTYFVEHYDRRKDGSYGAKVSDLDKETYDFVEFSWTDRVACCAKWKPAAKDVIEKLIGEPLA